MSNKECERACQWVCHHGVVSAYCSQCSVSSSLCVGLCDDDPAADDDTATDVEGEVITRCW